MQKTEILIGSPRKNGNTNSLASMLSKKIDAKKNDVSITYLYDKSIKPCNDCRACKKGKMECVLPDDMRNLYKRIESASVLIFGTPIYWFGPSAQMKLLLDRFRPYFGNKKLIGKKAVCSVKMNRYHSPVKFNKDTINQRD